MIYKWMKEHKQQRNIAIFLGIVEICICIIFFVVYDKTNNSEAIRQYDFTQMVNLGEKTLKCIDKIISIIIAIFGGPLILLVKKVFQHTGKIDKEKYRVVGKIYNTYDLYKLWLLSYLQLAIEILEWMVPICIFRFVVWTLEQIFKLKKQSNFIHFNLVILGLVLGAIILICIAYIITKSHLRSVTILLIYFSCILLLMLGFFVKNAMQLYIIIAFLSIALSWIVLHQLYKINMVEKKGSLRLCITIISRDILISVLLFGFIVLKIPYIFNLTYLMYIVLLIIDFVSGMSKNESGLKGIYIEIKNENKLVKTNREIQKIGDMVKYTRTDGIDKLINSALIKNIMYSYELSKLEQKLYRKIKSQRAICADLNDCKIIADNYKIKNDWIYFYTTCGVERRVNIYKLSDCIKLSDKTKVIKSK